MNTVITGKAAETLARHYLEEKGLILREKNYRYFGGEIDLIMQDQEIIVFVEVRLRNNKDYGSGFETITKSKQYKIIKTASHFLTKNNLFNKCFCRFDVISIQDKENITWIKNAFHVK